MRMRSRAERPRRSSPAGASSNSSGGEILSSSLRYSLGIGSPSSNAREVSLKAAADRSSPISLATSTDTSAPVKERPRIARSLCTDTLLLLLRSGSKRKRPPASAGVSAAGREASRGTAPVRRCALRALNVGRQAACCSTVRLFVGSIRGVASREGETRAHAQSMPASTGTSTCTTGLPPGSPRCGKTHSLC
jgi:hypothetical protein